MFGNPKILGHSPGCVDSVLVFVCLRQEFVIEYEMPVASSMVTLLIVPRPHSCFCESASSTLSRNLCNCLPWFGCHPFMDGVVFVGVVVVVVLEEGIWDSLSLGSGLRVACSSPLV